MSDNRIGTCSLCHGPVVMPSMSTRPVPYCLDCGAHPKQPYGPMIEMEPPKTSEELMKEILEPKTRNAVAGRTTSLWPSGFRGRK